jgi:MFS family permease
MPKKSALSSQHNHLQKQNERPRLFYGYILVATAFVIQILVWGIYNSYGVFFNPLLDDFGWPRATISGAASLSQITIGFGAIVLGNMNDRFGPRILVVFCGISAGLGYFLMSQINSIWQLYLFHGLIVGIGASGTDVILLSTTARWFVKRRGMMSGIVKIGTGVGIMIVPLIAAWLITSYGWRDSFSIIGITLAVVLVSGAQLLRRDPSRMGLLPDGEKTPDREISGLPETGLSLSQAARTLRFWMLCLAFFVILWCTFTIIIHFARYTVDLGFSVSFGATMISVIGGASIIGRLVMGISGDRVGSKRALLICSAVLIASFAWLQFAREAWSLVLFVVVYGFCHGGFYALVSPTVAEFFGTHSHGAIFGIVIFCSSIGGAIGPLVTGYIFDITDSYNTAFLLALALSVVGFASILFSGKTRGYSMPDNQF